MNIPLDKDAARQLVVQELEQYDTACVILDEHTREEDFGWVFFYQSRAFVETGDIAAALAGNAPFIVNKYDGSAHPTGTAYPIEHYLKNYRDTGTLWPIG